MQASLDNANTDFKEGVRSFLEKRAASFPPLSASNPVAMATELLLGSSESAVSGGAKVLGGGGKGKAKL
jgi:hypothetical protein